MSDTFARTVALLDEVCDWATSTGSRAGYFAALYGRVTRAVARNAANARFGDADRMAAFTSAFATRYLDALDAWRAGRPTTASWAVAFEAVGEWRPIVLQHLLLGINAHINLDLGVVAAETAGSPEQLPSLRGDFDMINRVLAELVDESQASLGRVSPWLDIADRFGAGHDEVVCRFSLRVARQEAWAAAERLVALPPAERPVAIERLDARVAELGRCVRHPGVWPSTGLLVVRLRERASVGTVVRVLRGQAISGPTAS